MDEGKASTDLDGYGDIRDNVIVQKGDVDQNQNGGSGGMSSDLANWGTGRIFKNLLVICFAFLCLFTAFKALVNLQSSINCDAGLGLASLSTIYATLVVSAILVPSVAIRLMGIKWTMAASLSCYAIYIGANFYPDWGTLIPTSALVGLAAAPLWALASTYVTTIAQRYAQISRNTDKATVSRFFGVFFLFIKISHVLGNLISSLVLQQDKEDPSGEFVCGANDCTGSAENSNVNASYCDPPEKTVTYTLLGIYLGSALVAVLLVTVFLDKLQTGRQNQKENLCQLCVATLRLWRDYRMVLLIPLTICNGLGLGFRTGDFTRSYVTCAVGVGWVGYIMVCYGITAAVCSLIVGHLAKYVGRVPIFTFGTLLQMALILTLLFWVPTKDQLVVYFVIAGCWGAADAIWQTQLNALYGVLFQDKKEAGFSNYRLCESLGYTISFAFSNFLCVWVKLTILATVLVIGIVFYYIIELKEYKQRQRYKERHVPAGNAERDLTLNGGIETAEDRQTRTLQM